MEFIFLFFFFVWIALRFIDDSNQKRDKRNYDEAMDYIEKEYSKLSDMPTIHHKPPQRKPDDTYPTALTGLYKRQYLQSKQWKQLRLRILKRDNYACKACGTVGVPLEVHHITYVRFTTELDSDLVSLCRSCHQHIHDRLGYSYDTTYPIKD